MQQQPGSPLPARKSELAELQAEYTRLSTKTGKNTKEDEKKLSEILADVGTLRKQIIDTETAYSSLFNHTADTKAQNRVIMWYVLNLTHIIRGEEGEIEPFFKGESYEEKENYYYELDEKNDPLYNLIQGKIATFMSYWYFASVVSKEDFDKLNEDIESGAA